MNCAIRFKDRVRENPGRLAIWTERHGTMSFSELHELTTRAQKMFHAAGVGAGDTVLLAALPSPFMFAAVCALLGIGAPILFVEPWLPIRRIDSLVSETKPKAFFTGALGGVWGARVPSIRKIPRWLTKRNILQHAPGDYEIASLYRESPAFIAFSSGTTGAPKGVVRTQGYMWDMHEILTRFDPQDRYRSPDLAVFPNVTLFQLGTGRGAILVPTGWKDSSLRKIARLPQELQPETVTCGPAFLKRLLSVPGYTRLRDFHVGGALTDRWIFEESFARWPEARFVHVYGGSEAEPVAIQDARKAVALSRERGLFQTLSLGGPVDILKCRLDPDSVWVSGPNVSPEYLGGPERNEGIKVRDSEGRLWHCMGDRIVADQDGWWYSGRQFQERADFDLEQRIYSFLDNSASFVSRAADGSVHLFGENVSPRETELRAKFPELAGVHAARIRRDRRHRARIDRKASLPRRLPKGFR